MGGRGGEDSFAQVNNVLATIRPATSTACLYLFFNVSRVYGALVHFVFETLTRSACTPLGLFLPLLCLLLSLLLVFVEIVVDCLSYLFSPFLFEYCQCLPCFACVTALCALVNGSPSARVCHARRLIKRKKRA